MAGHANSARCAAGRRELAQVSGKPWLVLLWIAAVFAVLGLGVGILLGVSL